MTKVIFICSYIHLCSFSKYQQFIKVVVCVKALVKKNIYKTYPVFNYFYIFAKRTNEWRLAI